MVRANSYSQFKLTERSDRFLIELDGLAPVEVALRPSGFRTRRVESCSQQLRLFSDCSFGCNYDCRCLFKCEGHCRGEEDRSCRGDCEWCFNPYNSEEWFPRVGPHLLAAKELTGLATWNLLKGHAKPYSNVMRDTLKLLRGPIRQQAERLLARADPTTLAIQKAAFKSAFRVDTLFLDTRLYQNQFLVRDLLAYPAAAVVATIAPEVHSRRGEAGRIRDGRNGLQELVLSSLENWQAILSPTGTAYRSLSRTLMNLPGRIPLDLLPTLTSIELERPITDRVELIALLEATDFFDSIRMERDCPPRALARAPNLRHFMHASRGELSEAMRRVSDELGVVLSTRSANDIRSMAQYLMVFPEPHRGKLAGLTRKSIAWHRDGAEQGLEELYAGTPICFEQAVTKPPIPLPNDPHLRFLSSVGDIYHEGVRMQHCVAQLTPRALSGEAYLFHCDYDGTMATIEVHESGGVIQASGPLNSKNAARQYGIEVLKSWGNKVLRSYVQSHVV